jgi:poly-gamma-glutamate synthesis protein (capsule biosynthesis protein)
MPLVPVVSFWSTRERVTATDLEQALAGTSERFTEVIVGEDDRDLIAEALGVQIGDAVATGTVEQIRAAVKGGALGILRASDVTPAVRALGIDDRELFGTRRVRDLAEWPLVVTVPETPERAFDPARSWSLAAAGDVLLDRGVARQVKVLGKGVDFPYDGGRVEITGFRCCSGLGHRVPTYRRTGDKGAVREIMKGADLSLVNMETPVDDDFRYHTTGTTFSGDPKLLEGMKNAGIDFASLANNHIGDAQRDGILDSIRYLDELGIRNAGAGKDLEAAARPASFDINGVKVGIIGCDWVAAAYWAKANQTGSNPCSPATLRPAIRAAKADHDIVIVFPHWGLEYRSSPGPTQRRAAASWMADGADLVIGNHAHWAQGFEEIEDGKLAFYALGNFVFDQMWQENTMQGLIIELTYDGTTLRQVRLHPTLVIDQAQPNLLDPAGDGQRVLRRVRESSEGMGLPY